MSAGTYVYCIMRDMEPRTFSATSMGGRGDAVHTLHCNGLTAVVSASPEREYESTRRNMFCHTAVLEEAMRVAAIVPTRFGTVATTPDRVLNEVLAPRYGELDALLQRVEGRVELGLKAIWREDVIMPQIVAASAPIREMHSRISSRSVDETYYERIKLGQLVEAELQRRRDADAALIMDRLRPLACETTTNSLISERMVLNAAFLVERTNEVSFDQLVRQLDAEIGQRMIFKYVGNAPPYNFVSISI